MHGRFRHEFSSDGCAATRPYTRHLHLKEKKEKEKRIDGDRAACPGVDGKFKEAPPKMKGPEHACVLLRLVARMVSLVEEGSRAASGAVATSTRLFTWEQLGSLSVS